MWVCKMPQGNAVLLFQRPALRLAASSLQHSRQHHKSDCGAVEVRPSKGTDCVGELGLPELLTLRFWWVRTHTVLLKSCANDLRQMSGTRIKHWRASSQEKNEHNSIILLFRTEKNSSKKRIQRRRIHRRRVVSFSLYLRAREEENGDSE
jgi:hypothetical protein